jgi:repressor of nif and glnA expression
MATFNFRFNEVSMNQVWFEAANLEEAQALFKKCMEDEMNISDLPNVFEKNRGIELDFSVSMLEAETPA